MTLGSTRPELLIYREVKEVSVLRGLVYPSEKNSTPLRVPVLHQTATSYETFNVIVLCVSTLFVLYFTGIRTEF